MSDGSHFVFFAANDACPDGGLPVTGSQLDVLYESFSLRYSPPPSDPPPRVLPRDTLADRPQTRTDGGERSLTGQLITVRFMLHGPVLTVTTTAVRSMV